MTDFFKDKVRSAGAQREQPLGPGSYLAVETNAHSFVRLGRTD
jgi:hypothetical protein